MLNPANPWVGHLRSPAPSHSTPSVLVCAPSGTLLLSPVLFPGSDRWPELSSPTRRVYAGNLTRLDSALEYLDGRALIREPDSHDLFALIALGVAEGLAALWPASDDQTLIVLPFEGDWRACWQVLVGPPPSPEEILDVASARDYVLQHPYG